MLSVQTLLNLLGVMFLALESALLYFANMVTSYTNLRWKLGKRLTSKEKIFVKSLITPMYIENWLTERKEYGASWFKAWHNNSLNRSGDCVSFMFFHYFDVRWFRAARLIRALGACYISGEEMLVLKKLWVGSGVKSDTGFSLKFKGLHNIEYREGDRLLIAFRERLVGDPAMDIDSSSIEKWEPPFDTEILSAEKKKEILERICEAANYLGISHVIR